MNWERNEFIDYLVETLIPDYIVDGKTGIAHDLVVAAYFMKYNVNHAIDRRIKQMYEEIEGVLNE